jgi:hypothetical protein
MNAHIRLVSLARLCRANRLIPRPTGSAKSSSARSFAQRAREADGWPLKVRKLSYWKGLSARKSFHAMEPHQQAGETPRREPGKQVRCWMAVAERQHRRSG